MYTGRVVGTGSSVCLLYYDAYSRLDAYKLARHDRYFGTDDHVVLCSRTLCVLVRPSRS